MIREDRVMLNERFVKIFKQLEDRGTIVKNDRNGRGVGDVAEKVLGNKSYGHIIRAYLDPTSKRVIDYGQARQFCRAYNISEAYMIEGAGQPFEDDSPMAKMYEMYTFSEGPKGNIVFTTTEAFAGTAVDVGSFSRESNSHFSIPGISGGNLVAFPINGNSMEPIINNGDIVVCREINSVQDVKDNEIYAVRTNGSVWVKYVKCIKNKAGRVTSLKLVSANYLEHDPFVEEVNEFTRLYKVIRRISQF
ncbi:MAG: LexA family transcriptional regulator [Saprospiraceae bacterium]|nr:LexA family transcriptional regulator [Saprospiraceae bacterium]